MTAVGKTVKIVRSVVTGTHVGTTTASLYVEGVDQDKDGTTITYHQLAFESGDLATEHPDVAKAVEVIRAFAQDRIDAA